MTQIDPENKNIQTEKNITNDTDLENLLEEAQKEANQAEADFAPLLNKIKELENQLKEKEEIAKNSQIAYLHLKSDFDILQRQSKITIENAERDALFKIIKEFLPFIENLRKSLLNLNDEYKNSAIGQGLQMMYDNFLRSLEKLGVKPIESLGLEPDPQFHEPVSMQATEDQNLKGKIIQEFEQGFYYEGNGEKKILSAAKVIIGQ